MRPAADLVSTELRNRSSADRGLFLRELLAYSAASLTLLEGEAAASEAVYRLADAMIGCSGSADA